MTLASIEDYLETAIDITQGLGGSATLLERLGSYRGRAAKFLDDPDAGSWMNEEDPDLQRFPLAFYSLLQSDGIAYCSDPGDFPENIPSNLLRAVERHGYRWEPQDYVHATMREIPFALIAPDGNRVEAVLSTPGGIARCDSGDVLDCLRGLIERTTLGTYEIPITSEQLWLVVTLKSSWRNLARRYGPRWKIFSSMEADWSAAPPGVPPK